MKKVIVALMLCSLPAVAHAYCSGFEEDYERCVEQERRQQEMNEYRKKMLKAQEEALEEMKRHNRAMESKW